MRPDVLVVTKGEGQDAQDRQGDQETNNQRTEAPDAEALPGVESSASGVSHINQFSGGQEAWRYYLSTVGLCPSYAAFKPKPNAQPVKP